MSKHLWLIRYPLTKSRHHGLDCTPIIDDKRAIDMPREVFKKDLIISTNYSVFKRRSLRGWIRMSIL
jgi:hypothetical protein